MKCFAREKENKCYCNKRLKSPATYYCNTSHQQIAATRLYDNVDGDVDVDVDDDDDDDDITPHYQGGVPSGIAQNGSPCFLSVIANRPQQQLLPFLAPAIAGVTQVELPALLLECTRIDATWCNSCNCYITESETPIQKVICCASIRISAPSKAITRNRQRSAMKCHKPRAFRIVL